MKQLRLFLLFACTTLCCLAAAQSGSSSGVSPTVPPATFFSFDFPGATDTQATALNIGGKIVGRYVSTDGLPWVLAQRHPVQVD
jgi:hypothetical protein